VAVVLLAACGDRPGGYGIDPSVADRPFPAADAPLDSALARAGADVFQDRCVACHKLGPGVAVGPDLRGVVERRDPVWIRGMVLNPDSMLRTDSVARALLYRYQVPMIDTGIGEPEFRALLEFLRASGGALSPQLRSAGSGTPAP
jgi:mono/diheme cytochrome c family protein